ncbi:MAG TPA: Gfo/Idh/MocA family oxidoreductase [Actinomycetota bacterium]|jgi:predicted dehydrogenase|nr:Gfo/Idh/MocA family oxidoreductase [Actinomycetota bacterium]
MPQPLRAGIVGTGFVGRVHARSARLAGAELVGVAASTPERGAIAAGELGAVRSFDSAHELVTSGDIDVVHICTPNYLHAPLTLAALEAGKHVICEKPLALDAATAREMEAAARKAGTVATVPFVYRYYPTVREARARIDSARIGDVHLVHGHYLQDWLHSDEDGNWRVDSELGGASRAFADIGSHWCDLIEFVTGHRITHVTAQLLTAFAERMLAEHQPAFSHAENATRTKVSTEDAATLLFRTDGGAIGTLIVSQISAGRKNRLWFEIDGSEAAVAFDQEHPETLWFGQRDGATAIARAPETLSKDAAVYATLPAGHPLGYHDCFDAFVTESYATITTGEAHDGLPRFRDGVRAAHITDAVLRSASEGRTVEVGT